MSDLLTLHSEFLSRTFWQSPDIHIALPPHQPAPPAQLLETARPYLPEGGCLFRTSGTTGTPKWVALEKRALLHSARVVNAHYDLTEADHWLLALPLHHVGGFSILARAFLSGSQVSPSPSKWQPTEWMKSFQTHPITATSLVPTQLHDLVATQLHAPPTLRLVLLGGGRIQPALFQRALELGWPVCATYGMTESASQIASQPLEHDRVNDPETLEILPHWHARIDHTNTLSIQGPALAKGYLSVTNEGCIWAPIDPACGLQTRDQVKLWSNGTLSFLKFLGRHENVIKVLGELVSLEILEQRLTKLLPSDFPAIALLALPDERREHRIALVIETPLKDPPEGLCNALAAFHSCSAPFEQIDSTLTMPEFPRTDLGKLNRPALTHLLHTLTLTPIDPSEGQPRLTKSKH